MKQCNIIGIHITEKLQCRLYIWEKNLLKIFFITLLYFYRAGTVKNGFQIIKLYVLTHAY